MRYIVKLRNQCMPVVRAAETTGLYHLRAEVSKNEDSRLVRPDEDGTNQELKLIHCHLVAKIVILVNDAFSCHSATVELTSRPLHPIQR